MNRILKLLFAVILLGVTSVIFAQMTDDQILEYVKEQASRGVDEKQIAKDLLAKGVSVQQLQSLRNKYSSLSASSGLDGDERSSSGSRTRTDNGESRSRGSNMNRDVDVDFDAIPYIPDIEPAERIFGHDIFRSEKQSFAPDMNIPTPSNYILGPGDEVIIDIYGSSQVSTSCKISPDGSISIPNEGLIYVSGLTAAQAQDRVRSTIGGHYLDSEIRLTVGQTRTILVHVMGEVRTPGSYTVAAFANAFNALYLSGGVTEIGTLRDVRISRGGRVIAHIDIYDFILNGCLSGDIALRDDDVILVGTYANLVKVEGKVKRPMCYEMKGDESLDDLIRYAGGFTGDAWRDRVRVERCSAEGLTVFNVNEDDMASFHNLDGDVVVAESVLDRYKNVASIEGAVFRPGHYRLDDDVHSVRTLVAQAGGLDEKAVTDLAVLIRMKEDRTQESVSVPLGGILSGETADIELRNEDNLVISSNTIRDSLRTFSILGEVYNPGEYSYSSGETVATLITRAGGVTEIADPSQVEIARRITDASGNPDGKALAQIFRVSPDNDLTLQPYDVVTILRSSDNKEQRMVSVVGEVKNAGIYALSNSEERLSSFISRAGGLTPNAFVGGAQITRTLSLKERNMMLLELESVTTEEDSLRIVNALAKSTYNIGTDLEQALRNPGSSKDLIIKDGDIITIPQLNNTVKISGAVLSPNTVNFEEGKKLSYYLNQAGGVSRLGRKSQTYILYANGMKTKASSGIVMPGCEIVVPTREKREVNPQAASIGLSAASVLASIAAVVASIIKK